MFSYFLSNNILNDRNEISQFIVNFKRSVQDIRVFTQGALRRMKTKSYASDSWHEPKFNASLPLQSLNIAQQPYYLKYDGNLVIVVLSESLASLKIIN